MRMRLSEGGQVILRPQFPDERNLPPTGQPGRKLRMKRRKVSFTFDERSLEPIEKLESQGRVSSAAHEFINSFFRRSDRFTYVLMSLGGNICAEVDAREYASNVEVIEPRETFRRYRRTDEQNKGRIVFREVKE